MRSLLAIPLLLPVCAHAQDIVVTGQTLPRPAGEAAYGIDEIDRDRLVATASNRIEDALKDVAGLTQFRRTDARSANATSQGATLRGLGGNASSRALVLLDGVPQSDPFGGWISWPAFAPVRLGAIRVTRGGGSGAAGPGALAGTIELESIGSGERSQVALSAGSRGALEGEALATARLGGGFGFLAGSYARGDGFVPIMAGQRGSADRRSPYEQASFAARAVIAAGPVTEVQAGLQAFTDRRERGTALSGNGGDGADASVRIVHRGRWAAQGLAYIQLRKFQSRFVAVDPARVTVAQTVDQFNVPSTGLGARFELRPPVGATTELRLGGDFRRTTGSTREFFTYVAGVPTRLREAGGQSDTAGVFGEVGARSGRLTLTGGGRIDRWWIRDGRLVERTLATGAFVRNEIARDRDGWEATGRAGLAFEAGSLSLRAAAYTGWRLPTLNELYRPFRVGADATAANPGLSPERMRGAEIGIDWRPAEAVTVRMTAFSNRLVRPIANVTLASGPGIFPGVGFVAAGGAFRQRQNLDAIQSNGFEASAAYARGDWSLRASYSLAEAAVRAQGISAALDRLRPAQVPRHTASATAGWRGLSATMRYTSGQFEDDLNLRALGNALTVDAVADVALGSRVSLILRGENVGNALVEAAVSGTGVVERASPRTFWAGIRFRN